MISRSTALVAALLACAVPGIASAQYFGGITLNPPRASVFESETLVPLAGIYTPPSMLDAGRQRYGLRLDLRTSPVFLNDGRNWSTASPTFMGTHTQAMDLGLSSAVPLSDRFTLIGRLAVVSMKPDAGATNFLSPYGYRSNRMSLGMQYDLSRSLGLRFEMARQHYLQGTGFDGESDRNFTLGMSFRF